MLASLRPVLRAVGVTVVPEAARLDDPGWSEVERIVAGALASRPPALQRQFRLLLRAVEWLPVLRYGRRFTGLDPARRSRFLNGLQDAPLLLVRRGTWGLRTLLLMGYYGRPQAAGEIGYRGHPDGWSARQGARSP